MNFATFFAFWPAPDEIFFFAARNIPPWFAKVRVESNNMGTEHKCSTCGKALEANAPGGLCPECLIKVGLGSGVDPGADTKTGATRRDFVPPAVEKLGPLFPQLEILELIVRGMELRILCMIPLTIIPVAIFVAMRDSDGLPNKGAMRLFSFCAGIRQNHSLS